MNRGKNEARVVTVQEYEEHIRNRKNGGGPDESGPKSLREVFDDMTHNLRHEAREVVRKQQLILSDFLRSADPNHPKREAAQDHAHYLDKIRKRISGGGVGGALKAWSVLRNGV